MVWYANFETINNKKTIKKILIKEVKAKGIKFKGNKVIFKVKDDCIMVNNSHTLMKQLKDAGEKINSFH